MKTLPSFFKTALALGIVLFVGSCNNSTSTDATTKTDTSKMLTTTAADTSKPAPAAAPAMAAPFDMAEVNLNVKDAAAWRLAFDSNVAKRKEAGLSTIVLSHLMDKPNSLQVAFGVADVQKAKDFYANAERKAMMQRAGVIGAPRVDYLHVIRFNPNSHEKQWVEITHKVKDFAAWMKVYDAEGTATRLGEGMVDVVMARSMADSNTVHLIFDISDMAKAKAAIASPEKKKLMMSAGVMGAPTMEFFQEIAK